MAIYRKQGGSNIAITTIRRRSGASWVVPSAVKRRVGNTWVIVWPPFSATPSKTFLSGQWSQTTSGTLSDSVTITCSGGSGSYSIVSVSATGAVNTIISGLTVTASATGQNTRVVGTLTIVVTDGLSQTTLYVDYEFVFGTGGGGGPDPGPPKDPPFIPVY